ncbi:hypothetical protein B0I72DRAFT_140213 [Yarrowia lipolytica]|uniref:YALI0B00770p n=2 Tax=Yarrowia lipolytica TaxID=4952 RepID=Q6CG54_YARLI|nr:YALI0B00770p [Yarrowia lipolytica CLIB122]AOW01012.1 hypothetical protein YALI1_B00977g [Yarrowia lipolytica]KAB8281516.1 hypothetical protein BKA91DRAFT_140122 [Yarrowia lipolytica]KAE8172887.1 hypothetical protein BKA90DRAFT_136481 [Yarrowia lipolytica]KAJ8051942.1 hypothetical protein LXG23DRAFT_25353 [Yarrowia lipolytica]RDW24854.1 hypothetical protein B0I71DRAFT_133590 [Yarrowia lipolytica]|eukprot:XP_500358.2 YALI0B00770p [Yarrowia lipolytica CLIB122]
MFLFIPFTFGSQNFGHPWKGHESERYYCPNCHNMSCEARKRREFITLCFVPIIPIHWSNEIKCTICNWSKGVNEESLKAMQQDQGMNRPQPDGHPALKNLQQPQSSYPGAGSSNNYAAPPSYQPDEAWEAGKAAPKG